MKENIELLIEKFWAGTASLEERQALLTFLKGENHALRERMESSFQNVDDPQVLRLIDDALQDALLNKIHERSGISMQQKKSARRTYWPMLQIGIAASLFAVAGIITWIALRNQERPQTIAKQVVHQPDSIIYHNETKVAEQITLPDSSVVVLYPHGRLYHTATFGDKTRQVHLAGMAKFRVTHDKTRPFTVFANGYATTALGTEFIVDTQEAGKTMVNLLSGKVVVQDLGHSRVKDVYLRPGDELRINDGNGKFEIRNTLKKRSIDAENDKSRQYASVNHNADLQFNQTPLEQVFARISMAKNIPISTEDVDLKNKVFTGELLPTDSLQMMLSIICDVNDLAYKHEENHIIITKK